MVRTHRASVTILAALLLCPAGAVEAGWKEGVWSFKAASYDRAAEEFARVVQIRPDWAGGHYMLGWTYLKQNRLTEADLHLGKAHELRPGRPIFQLRLGELYVVSGRHAEAVALLRELDSSSLHPAPQSLLAELRTLAFTGSARDDPRLAELARAAAARPDGARAQFDWGNAAYEAGDTFTAVAALEKASRLDPDDLDKLSAYTRALLRQGRENRGEAGGAAYRKAVAAASRLAAGNATHDNQLLLGEALLGAGRHEPAIGALERAAALNTDDWLAPYYIGQAYTAMGRLRDAETALKLTLGKAEGGPQKRIWRALGFVHEKQRRIDDAILAYRHADYPAGEARARRQGHRP